MSSLQAKQIVSIYDLMIERRRKQASESQLKDISIGTRNGLRRKIDEEASPNSKDWKKHMQLPRKKVLREPVSLRTLESEPTLPSNAVTASHLTKKQTFMKIHSPAKKEIINKLVEKISMVRGRPKGESVDPQPAQKSPRPKSKQGSGTQRKEMGNPGTARNKQKAGKSNSSLGNRQPLSPRKAIRGPKEKKADRIPREKTTLMQSPKIKSPKTSRLQMRMAKQSERSAKNAPLSTDRWRI